MRESRRKFLVRATAGVVGAAASSRVVTGQKPSPVPTPVAPQTPVAGMPPAFGTAPPVGPEITPTTVVEAQKFVRIEYTPAEQAQIAASWPRSMASTMERRTGPRKLALEETLDAGDALESHDPRRARRSRRASGSSRAPRPPGPLPGRDADIAFAPVTALAHWIQTRALSSERLTASTWRAGRPLRWEAPERDHPDPRPGARPGPTRADAEIAGGKYRGPLHGIPFGVKDLLDTKGILTTYGAPSPTATASPRRMPSSSTGSSAPGPF